jgi:hypothetical protein
MKRFLQNWVHLFMTPLYFVTPSLWAPNTANFVHHCAIVEIKPPGPILNRSSLSSGKFKREVSTGGFCWGFRSSVLWCCAICGSVPTIQFSASFRKQQYEQGQRTNAQAGVTLLTLLSFKTAQRPARSITFVWSEKFPKWQRINTIDNVDKWLPR